MASRRASDWLLPEHEAAPAAAPPVRRKASVEPIGADLLRLQRTAGNAAVVGLLGESAPAGDTIRRRRGKGGAKKAAAPTVPAPTTAQAPAPTTTTTPSTTTTTTATTAPATTAPTAATTPVRDARAVALESVIGKGPMERMTAQFGGEAEVIAFAEQVGSAKLKQLIEERKMTAAQLQTAGAPFLKRFVGAGDKAWKHLTTGHTNAAGAISGAHDEDVFYETLDHYGYHVTNQRNLGGGVIKLTYRSGDGTVTGSKTVIRGLAGAKSTWMGIFNNAIWNAVKSGTLTAGTMSYAQDDDGWSYGYFYKSGAAEVDTVFPA